MKIKNINVYQVEVPLRVKFSQSNNSTWKSSSTIVELETFSGIKGYGETCPRPYVTGETPHSVIEDLIQTKFIWDQRSFADLEEIKAFILQDLGARIGPAALCGFELALLDAWGKTQNQSLIQILGGDTNHEVTYSGVVPSGNTNHYQKVLNQLTVFDFPEIKLKVGTDLKDNIEKLRLIKEAFSPDIPPRVDVNTAWNLKDATEQIPSLINLGVTVFEQIFPKGQETLMGEITRLFGGQVKIMADESITTLQEAKTLVENHLCNHFNLKISKNGGILQTLNIYHYLTQKGYTCQLGAHFGETSLLTAAGLIFSSLAKDLTANEGGLGKYLLEEDISEPSLRFNQKAKINLMHLQNAPGLGISVDPGFLEKYQTFRNQL
ncbi:MAG: hypothetical protein KDE26_21115 [Bacteroidetes bacterium]|nr:hypothetical protein [Bacteroidota bacterium]